MPPDTRHTHIIRKTWLPALLLALFCLPPINAQDDTPSETDRQQDTSSSDIQDSLQGWGWSQVAPGTYVPCVSPQTKKAYQQYYEEMEGGGKSVFDYVRPEPKKSFWDEYGLKHLLLLSLFISILLKRPRSDKYRVQNESGQKLQLAFKFPANPTSKREGKNTEVPPGAVYQHRFGWLNGDYSTIEPLLMVRDANGREFLFDLSPFFSSKVWDRRVRSFWNFGERWPIIITLAGNAPDSDLILHLPMKNGEPLIVHPQRAIDLAIDAG